MTAALVLSTLVCLAPAGIIVRDSSLDNRKPNPLAPSLPLLSKEEQREIQGVIDRFIQFETGKLSAKESAKALADFKKLGPEATFQLIAGLNFAANIESSCPAVVIGRRLAMILSATVDVHLLDFARENIGAGVTARRHMNTIKDLRLGCAIRKGELQSRYLALGYRPGEKTPLQMTVKELTRAAGRERGLRLQAVLTELEKRQGEPVLNTLGAVAESYEPANQKLARTLLSGHLDRQGTQVVREALKSDQVQVRIAAAKAAGARKLPLGVELIELLGDQLGEVRQAARQALVKLSKGLDYGPEATAGETERAEAVRLWRAWWDRQGQQGASAR